MNRQFLSSAALFVVIPSPALAQEAIPAKTDHAFDHFAADGADRALNRKLRGL